MAEKHCSIQKKECQSIRITVDAAIAQKINTFIGDSLEYQGSPNRRQAFLAYSLFMLISFRKDRIPEPLLERGVIGEELEEVGVV